MLVSEIVRRVRTAAGDMNALIFTNETITDWMNDAIRECVVDNSLLQARASTNTDEAVSDYVLPPDHYKLHSVYVDDKPIRVMTLEEWQAYFAGKGSANETGTPAIGYVFAGSLTLWPTPDHVTSLQINYSKLPETLTYSDSPQGWLPVSPAIPTEYHSRIVTYCLAQIAMQDDDINKYTMLMEEFRTGVIDLRHAANTQDDLYPFISVSERDAGGW